MENEDEATPSKSRIIPSPPVSVPNVQDVTHKIKYMLLYFVLMVVCVVFRCVRIMCK